MRRLVRELERLPDEVAVVFDGRPFDLTSDKVEVVFASRRGRDAADDDIAARAARDPDPETLTVVTSDAELARRAREHGARVESAGRFLRRLEGGGLGSRA